MTDTIPLKDWQDRAAKVLPAGGFGNFDPSVVISRGEAAHVWDADGTEYVDYLIGSGPMLVGHAHPEVLDVVQEQVAHVSSWRRRLPGPWPAPIRCGLSPPAARRTCMPCALPAPIRAGRRS